MSIVLNLKSQTLIEDLEKMKSDFAITLQKNTERDAAVKMERQALVEWLQKTETLTQKNEKERLAIASLRASLLKDLKKSLRTEPKKKKDKSESKPWSAKAKLIALAIAGTIFFGCEGFDGITAFMGIFSSIPTVAIFAAGLIFSALSIIVFYSFDLREISKNLGVTSKEAPHLMDVLLNEFKQIQSIRLELTPVKNNKTKQDLISDLAIAKMLQERHKALNKDRLALKAALDNPYLKIGKMVTAGLAGIIFFSGGFFAGQTVSLAIAGLFAATVAATFWPIILASIVVGIAAFGVYWFVERPGIENLISRWKGLDKEKIDALCTQTVVDEETENLDKLVKSLENQISKATECEELVTQNQQLGQDKQELITANQELKSNEKESADTISQLLEHIAGLQEKVRGLEHSIQGVHSGRETKTIIVVLPYARTQTFFGNGQSTQSIAPHDNVSLPPVDTAPHGTQTIQ